MIGLAVRSPYLGQVDDLADLSFLILKAWRDVALLLQVDVGTRVAFEGYQRRVFFDLADNTALDELVQALVLPCEELKGDADGAYPGEYAKQ